MVEIIYALHKYNSRHFALFFPYNGVCYGKKNTIYIKKFFRRVEKQLQNGKEVTTLEVLTCHLKEWVLVRGWVNLLP